MFILDDEVKSGTAYVYGDVSYSTAYRKEAAGDKANYSISGSTVENSLVSHLSVESGGTGITWRRMSDGTLVEKFGGRIRSSIAAVAMLAANSGSLPLIWSQLYEDDYHPGTYGYYTILYPSLAYYTLPTLDGAQYKAGLIPTGYDPSTLASSDWQKYITATGYTNWDLQDATQTGFYKTNTNVVTAPVINSSNQIVTSNNFGGFRLIAKPNGTAPIITPEQTALGTISDPTSVTLQLVGSPSVTVSYDGQPEEAVQTNVGNVTINLADKWDSLSLGSHTITVRSSQSGYKCGAIITFSKTSTVVSVTTKPHLTIERPSMVKVVGDLVVPSGAELTVDVSNNAGDESPQWEPCGDDMTHYFANTTKTADQWGLAVRVSIDNSGGSSNAEIRNSIAAGVVYEREA